MSLITLSLVSVIAILVAIILKKINGEYSTLISIGACLFIISYTFVRLKDLVNYLEALTSYIQLDLVYFEVIMKMIGIAYICEFASCICKDAGYSAVASQIELAGKVSMLAISIPVLLSVIDMVVMLVGG